MKSNRYCNRRTFCCRLLGGLGALFCSGHWPAAAATPYGRPADRYTLETLPATLQAGNNPHLINPQRQLRGFAQASADRSVPGAVFTTGGNPVRATAAGIVHFVGQRPLRNKQSGGYYLRIAHDLYDGLSKPFYPRVTLYRHQAYRSTYYGLEKVSVEHWQTVERGQAIGYGLPFGASDRPGVKLVLEERGNPVNPDDYGIGHGFMRYITDGRTPGTDLEEMHRRLDRQVGVIQRLVDFYSGRREDDIHRKIHGFIDTEKFSNYPVIWSTVERWRYLTYRYRQSSQLFPGLSTEELESLTRTFLENQPIVLTLPLTPRQ